MLHNGKYILTGIGLFLSILFYACKSEVSDKTSDNKKPITEQKKEQPVVQDNGQNQSQSDTPALPAEYYPPDELKVPISKTDVIIEKFFPIGWSSDGKFAYVIEPADEACGCYMFRMAIQNMVSDKIDWDWDYNDNGKGDDFKSTWQKNYNTFKKELKQYKIIQIDKIALGTLNFQNGGKNYTLRLETQKKKDESFGIDFVSQIKIVIESKGFGQKTVFESDNLDDALILSASIKGYVKSPHEDRIAVIYIEERRGYEGPPNVVEYKIVGCKLTDGFKL